MLKIQPQLILVLQCALLLSACNNKEPAKTSGQIIAKVNGEEISIHQLNYVLSQNKGITKDNLESAKMQVSQTLVDQALLNQQALTDKLDRDPQIMMAIEQAKRQILAQAWLEKAASAAPKPSAQEVDQYYQEHPELFAKHKTFKLKEVLINKTQDNQAKIEQILAANKKVDEVVKQLTAENITYKEILTVKGAENLPIQQLTTISSLSDGQFITMEQPGGLLILAVLSTTEENIEKTKAAPIIETFLLNQQRKSLIEKRVKELKDKAGIEFTGEFSALNKNTQSATEPATPTPPTSNDKAQHDVITQGVKGL